MNSKNLGVHLTAVKPRTVAFLQYVPAVLAILACSGSLQAQNRLSYTPSTITLSCNTSSGPGTAATVVVKPVTALTGTATLAVSLPTTLPGGLTVTAPTVQTLSTANQAAGITYSFNIASGCTGASTGAVTFKFKAGGVDDNTVTANVTVTAPLTVNPSAITLFCTLSGSTYTPAAPVTVSVTAAAPTAFTVDTTSANLPSYVSASSTTGGTASTTAVTFTLQAVSPCNSLSAGGSSTFTMKLLVTGQPDRTVPVTLKVVPPSPLSIAPAAPTLTYVKGSGTAGKVDVNLTSGVNPAPFFTVDTTSLPVWMTVDSLTGTTPKSLRFSTTTVADSLAPGTYSASIRFKVSGYSDYVVTFSALITNGSPKLRVSEGTQRNLTWTVGTPLPTPSVTLVSTDSPISYSIVSGGTLAPVVPAALTKGLAYSFGTVIPVTFDPLIFAAAQPGTDLTGTITVTWGSPTSTVVITFVVTVLPAGATVTSLSPANLPTAASGQVFTVVVTGNGFVPSSDPAQKTKVGIVVGGVIVTNTNIASNVINSSNIVLTITVPAVADTNLPFAPSGTGGSVTLGVCNPSGTTCSTPTGTATLAISPGPIVQTVTSASSFIQVSPPSVQTISPYAMLSIFGTGFCSSGGTGCTSSQILFGSLDSNLRYGTSLSPDPVSSTQRLLKVGFYTKGTTTSPIAFAPILFASNNQINIMVPSGLAASVGNQVDMIVSFGYGTSTTLLSSAPYTVNVAATSPGIFTVGANGQGSGAILSGIDYTLIGAGKEAGIRTTATDSDTVVIFMSGLGAPDSTADNASAGSGFVYGSDCISISSFLTSLNAQGSGSLTNVDGTILQSSLLNTNRLAPCITSGNSNVPTVKVGGVTAPVTYAGWVADSVAGLYQINARLPGRAPSGGYLDINGTAVSSVDAPVQLPVVVTTTTGVTSQSGVSLWVAPKLKVTAPTALTGAVGTPWPSSNNAVTAAQGSSPYRYSLATGLLPSGLTLNASTGAITGTPAANTSGTYKVTVKATDSSNVPVSDTTTFTLSVGNALFVTASSVPLSGIFTGTFGTAIPTLTTVSAAGGTFPYTYTIASPPTGVTINSSTGAISVSNTTAAGTYSFLVNVTDSTVGTPVTGTITINLTINLNMASSGGTTFTGTAGTAIPTLTTVTATGGTSPYSYAITTPPTGISINSSTGVISVGTGAVAGSYSLVVTATDSTSGTPATGTITINLTLS